jgi:predicted dehydrogenase
MRIAIVGCGFVADFYVTTLPNYPDLELVGVYDVDAGRARRFAGVWGVGHVYDSLDDVLGDDRVEIVINLTNPGSHFETTRACLLAGKHVYSEKPLAMSFEDAEALVELAEESGLSLSGAPGSLLGEAAQTMWKALRDGLPGRVRLVYADLERPVFRTEFREWVNPSGLAWPLVDQFETGVALEHAGYHLTWLAAFFGPVSAVTGFSAIQAPDKAPEIPPERMRADFAVGCLEFESGVVARVTCALVAARDHRLRVFGDRGTLWCRDVWMYDSPVYFEPWPDPSRLRDRLLGRFWVLNRAWATLRRPMPLVREPRFVNQSSRGGHVMDFARGAADQAAAIRENREPRLSARFMLHINEVSLAMQPQPGEGGRRTMRSTFDPIEPMPWAR